MENNGIKFNSISAAGCDLKIQSFLAKLHGFACFWRQNSNQTLETNNPLRGTRRIKSLLFTTTTTTTTTS